MKPSQRLLQTQCNAFVRAINYVAGKILKNVVAAGFTVKTPMRGWEMELTPGRFPQEFLAQQDVVAAVVSELPGRRRLEILVQ